MLPCPSLISRSLFKLMSIESVMPSNHLIVCHPLFLLSSFFHNLRVFSNESSLHVRWPMCGSFSIRFPLGLTGLICLLSKGLSRVFSSATIHYAHSQFIIYFAYSFTISDFYSFKFTFSHFQPIFFLYNLCNCKMLT